MHELKREYTIVIVTHNMQQAARVADMTAFFSVDVARGRKRAGTAFSSSTTRRRRSSRQPSDKRTEDYVTGRFGMRVEFQERLHILESSLQEHGALVPARRFAEQSTRSRPRTSSSATR